MKKQIFQNLKNEVINILDMRGWDDKYRVDLRNKQSMIEYLRFYEIKFI